MASLVLMKVSVTSVRHCRAQAIVVVLLYCAVNATIPPPLPNSETHFVDPLPNSSNEMIEMSNIVIRELESEPKMY